tara:strand:- start:5062 stop:5361 length:300 start_codon:yes stop_codon:yes gene_type:complete
MIDLLIKILPLVAPAIRYADNPNRNPWRVDLLAYTLFVWLADMVLAHTAWAYHMGFPKRGEVTISHTLERLYPKGDTDAVRLAKAINFVSPNHIKAAAK